MKLNLKNPLVFFDLETTGTNINSDRIVEICYLKVYPNGNEEAKTMRINPEMPIPAESSAVHGIYDEDVADCPTFKEVARNIANDIEGCDLAGFNSNRFDIPVLAEEFLRAGVDLSLIHISRGGAWQSVSNLPYGSVAHPGDARAFAYFGLSHRRTFGVCDGYAYDAGRIL